MSDKKSFVMYKSWLPMFADLEDEDLGKLMKAICAYQMGEEIELPSYIRPIFTMIKATFQEDEEKYAEKCAKNAENGSQGGRPKKRTEATETDRFLEKRPQAKKADKDKDSDKDSEKDLEKPLEAVSSDDDPASCPEPFEPEADVELIPLNDGSGWRPTMSLYEEYVRLYPNVDVNRQFREMRAWCLNNPAKRKTKRGITRFVGAWLAREQDKGPPKTEKPKVKQTAFNSFSDQHSYDFDTLGRSLGWHGAINSG